jgi:hypothetical protein
MQTLTCPITINDVAKLIPTFPEQKPDTSDPVVHWLLVCTTQFRGTPLVAGAARAEQIPVLEVGDERG